MSYASERKILTPVLRKVANRDVRSLNNRDFSAAEQVLARWGRKPKKLDPKLHKKLIEQKTQRASARASHNQETAKVYVEVEKRAADNCECGCGLPISMYGGPEMDHFYGRARAEQTPANCWYLTGFCHRRKTANIPSRQYWDLRFAAHCAKYGYEFRPRLVKSLPAKAGGAP